MDDNLDIFNLGLDAHPLSQMWDQSSAEIDYTLDCLSNGASPCSSNDGSSDNNDFKTNGHFSETGESSVMVSGHHNYARPLGLATEHNGENMLNELCKERSDLNTTEQNSSILTIRISDSDIKSSRKQFSENSHSMRGRKPVVSETNKNAMAARMNRIKKKKYVESLEKIVHKLKSENTDLRSQVNAGTASIKAMSSELKYLKGVIGNIDEISSLVRGLKNIPGINLNQRNPMGSVELNYKRKVNLYEDSNLSDNSRVFTDKKFKAETMEQEAEKSGICLHIGGGTVSLELCNHCSESAVKDIGN